MLVLEHSALLSRSLIRYSLTRVLVYFVCINEIPRFAAEFLREEGNCDASTYVGFGLVTFYILRRLGLRR